ncbi:SRPBCC family protein [Paenibacillus hexagrammi]|uniref:SRPBCC family protein n=1 Tax=Paenibacillus hexagrammi TaxID=2908839 RepID=A0ABY3SPU4_9BACL|nr:SRPBCC family protein [Paenibacillus sp. YPD9-1]UJF35966.1 SRPBCC family protein [Paenibacillus sp. YPD9-1]
MPTIKTTIIIDAPAQICFDLARSIDIHMQSTSQTHERAVAGRRSGLIERDETVTWEATHFGIRQRLSVRITEFEAPRYFVDEQMKGAFKWFKHSMSLFPAGGTQMIDIFVYESPLGILGKLADVLFLKRYMTQFLEKRNEFIKHAAEERVFE